MVMTDDGVVADGHGWLQVVMGGYGAVRDCYGVVFGWYGWLLSSYRLFLVV